MINYNGQFESKKDVTVNNLPAGAYVGKILGAKVETQNIGGRDIERLIIQLDVTEGEYKDHYVKTYEAAKGGQYPAKFKGVLRLNIPKAGDQYEGMNKRILQGAAWALEESNKGYHWDWDESKLKGLSVGFSVREADYLIEDADGIRTGTTTEIVRLESVQDVKNGEAKPVKKRELKEEQKRKLEEYNRQINQPKSLFTAVDEELPF